MSLPTSPFANMSHRGRGEPASVWLKPDTPPQLAKHEHQRFADSCARIDTLNKGLAKIASILRETNAELVKENVAAWKKGGAA